MNNNFLHIGLQRLYRQGLIKRNFRTPEEVVSWLGAVQGQDYYGTKWSIGIRIPGTADDEVERAIAQKKIIRTWLMRGTLHFTAAKDIRWITKFLAPGIISSMTLRDRQLSLTEKIYSRSLNILEEILRGGKQLTRDEIKVVLKKNKINVDGIQLSHILQRAGLQLKVCFGVRNRKQFTYTLLDEWYPPGKDNTPDDPLAELTFRYFKSRGPARLQDYIWWSGLKASAAQEGVESIKSKLNEIVMDKKVYYTTDEPVKIRRKFSSAFLLPGFDEYLVAYKDRSDVLDPKYTWELNAGGGIFSSTIIIDGIVRGTWRRVFKKEKAEITIEPFNPFTKLEIKAVIEAAENYGKFLKVPADIVTSAKREK